MSQPHTEALERKHAQIELELDREVHRPMPDMSRVAELKKRKLRLKDELLHTA